MGGQAAEQIIAGVVLSERLAVTMYGAIHRAQFNGQRNLRGLVVDAKILSEDTFRLTLTDPRVIESVTRLDHPNIVATATVESGGSDVVVVTRGSGRYVTVQDLIASSKGTKQAGKLSIPVAGLIGKSVIEALATAHRAGVIHGAVHPRSVLIDSDGAVRLGDFVVGRALTTAVAQGADSSLWRGLSGYIAPELVVGEDPSPGVDVFAVGAMLFTMFSGEAPPGALRVTPAVERLVQRALDTDPQRRYKSATDLLENLLEAMEDDHWELADRNELVREAGLSRSDSNIDDATEDLLASLGTSAVSVTPTRPSMDLRAEASIARQKTPSGGGSNKTRLDALIADLGGEQTGVTHVDVDVDRESFHRDPISELINLDPRRREAIVSTSRVPSLDDPDEETPLPKPAPRDSSADFSDVPARSKSATVPLRPSSSDERAALDAIGDLDVSSRRVSTAAEQASAAAEKLEHAAERAERAALRVETGQIVKSAPERPKPAQATPIVPIVDDYEPPRLTSPIKRLVGGVILVGLIGGAGVLVYNKYNEDEVRAEQAKKQHEEDQKSKEELEAKLRDHQPDPGAIEISASGAGIWLRLGRTPLDAPIHLPANQQHDLVLLHDGDEPTEAQINGPSWSGAKSSLKATIAVSLKPSKTTQQPELPLQPTSAVLASTGVVGSGAVHIDSTPPDAEVWLFIGANHAQFSNVWAGRDYECAVVKPGFKTQHVAFKADEWRDGGDPNMPIDAAKKKAVLSRTVELEPDPKAKPDPKKGR